jgi:ankyrin repeat protein
MSDALPLPPRPSLEQYKKLARDLQRACESGDATAIRSWAARWIDTLARLQGRPGGPDGPGREHAAEKLERHWIALNHKTERRAACALTTAQFFLAREHGFTSWPRFARHVEDLTRAQSPVSAFEAAADAIVSGDAPALRRLLAGHPGLARERSTREHRSTLLHYVSANGVEDFRQKTPTNIVEIAHLLLDAGADVDAESDAYGGGCTALGLAATSAHPEKAGVQIALLQTLVDRGANLHLPAGGNGHSIVHGCLANGQPAAARFLADLGAPLGLESAAALGRLDVLRRYFDGDAQRAEPSRQQIESAFLYACGYGSIDAARFLLDRGVDPGARDDEGQTALHWAAWSPQIDVTKLLLQRGAPVDAKDQRFHATPLDVALWSWNNAAEEDREGYYEAVAALARAGGALDRDHWRDRTQGDSPVLRRVDSDARMQAALRGELPR